MALGLPMPAHHAPFSAITGGVQMRPRGRCENPLMIKELRRPKLTECDWQFFPRRNGVIVRRVRELKSPHRQCVASSHHNTNTHGL